jgi:hypothetical protein
MWDGDTEEFPRHERAAQPTSPQHKNLEQTAYVRVMTMTGTASLRSKDTERH